MTKVSVIIPVYNVEEYLSECLDSVLNQDFDNYEVICVEDCSTDGSLKILEEYEINYDQLKIIRHKQNMGLSCARNTGIEVANGEYIQFVDSDDMIKPNTLKILYNSAKKNNVDVLYFNMVFLNDERNLLVRNNYENKTILGIHSGRKMFCIHQKEKTYKPEAVRHFVNREFLIRNKINFYPKIIHEDILFSFLVSMHAEKAMDLNESMYVYRQRSTSISWSQKSKSAPSMFICLLNICSFWLSMEFSDEENYWMALYIENLYNMYRYYKHYEDESFEIIGYKEKIIYELLQSKLNSNITFSDDDISLLLSSNMKIVYGAGRKAVEIIDYANKQNWKIDAVIVSKKEGNPNKINGIPVQSVFELAELIRERNAIVIIGTDEKYYNEIIELMKKLDIHNIIKPQSVKK